MTQELPHAKKSLGQHWLTDSAVLESICEAGDISDKDTVLEIGPGTGTLTEKLIGKAGEVVAVEFDKQLARELARTMRAPNLQIIESDILRFDFSKVTPNYKVIANIPYYLTSNLIRVLSETPNRATRVVILIQKEVAERVASAPGGMSLLSVSAQFYWEVSLGIEVPARAFTPAPKVDSQVLILQRRVQPLFPGVDEAAFFQLVKSGYSARRKTLLNSLSGGLRADKDIVRQVLDEAYVTPTTRAQALSLEQWHMLYLACRTLNLV